MIARPRGTPLCRSAAAALVLLLACRLAAGEPLVCRGFDAASAANALTAQGGSLLRLDPALRPVPVWFILPESTPDAARQAMAHALGCWWSGPWLTTAREPRGAEPVVRAYPPLPSVPPQAEELVRSFMRPWLSGDGGLVLDPLSGIWTMTTSPRGHAQAELLLGAISDPHPRAPNLPAGQHPPATALARAPAGATLAEWCLDLGRLAGMPLALGADVAASAPAPAERPTDLDGALTVLQAAGVRHRMLHGVLCLGTAQPVDREHPAERAEIALLPAGHLTRDMRRLDELAGQLRGRVLPDAWTQPGWGIAAIPGSASVLVAGSPEAIHAVMTALEAADQAGLDAWLR